MLGRRLMLYPRLSFRTPRSRPGVSRVPDVALGPPLELSVPLPVPRLGAAQQPQYQPTTVLPTRAAAAASAVPLARAACPACAAARLELRRLRMTSVAAAAAPLAPLATSTRLPVLCFNNTTLDLRGLALRERLAQVSDLDALALLFSAGNVPTTRGRKASAFMKFLAKRAITNNPIHAALLVCLDELRRGLAATTVLSTMRTLEVCLWAHAVVELKREPEWLGVKRGIARGLAAAPLPKPSLPWAEVNRRAKLLDPVRKIAAAIMVSSGARYKTIAKVRAGDLLRVADGPLWVVLRGDKVRSPAFAFTYAIPPGSWAESVLLPLALAPDQMRDRFAHVDWINRPLLADFSKGLGSRWPLGESGGCAAASPR